SLSPRIITPALGVWPFAGAAASDAGVWPIAGATAPTVKPPASAALPLRNALRSGRFEPMGFSFADEPTEVASQQRSIRPFPGSNRAPSGAVLRKKLMRPSRGPWYPAILVM